MESPGELYDKISILEIRLEKHTDVKACVEIRDKIVVLKLELARWDGPRCLLAPTHKLRATPAGARLESFSSRRLNINPLGEINRAAWENEDKRDLFMRPPTTRGELEHLRMLDLREQQLNQDRNAIIDAINAKWLKGERP